MPLDVANVAVEEVDASMSEGAAEDVEEVVEEAEQEVAEEVVGGVSGTYKNGIDISDVTRYFEKEYWSILSNDTKKV